MQSLEQQDITGIAARKQFVGEVREVQLKYELNENYVVRKPTIYDAKPSPNLSIPEKNAAV